MKQKIDALLQNRIPRAARFVAPRRQNDLKCESESYA